MKTTTRAGKAQTIKKIVERQPAKREAWLRCLQPKRKRKNAKNPAAGSVVGAVPLRRGRLGRRVAALRCRAPAPGAGAVARAVGAALPARRGLGRRSGARAGPGART